MKIQFLLPIFLTFLTLLPASAHEEAEGAPNIGKSKGVTHFDELRGFKISEKAERTLGIEFRRISSLETKNPPAESIVHIQEKSGIYRRLEGWISFTEMTKTKQALSIGDEIAIKGTSFLRIIEADLNTGHTNDDEHNEGSTE